MLNVQGCKISYYEFKTIFFFVNLIIIIIYLIKTKMSEFQNSIEDPKRPIPKKIFIVPYRNRIQHKFFFSKYMTFLLEDQKDNYEIYFSHQHDERNFNRGATRNIGFLSVKAKYPNDYK